MHLTIAVLENFCSVCSVLNVLGNIVMEETLNLDPRCSKHVARKGVGMTLHKYASTITIAKL